MGLSVADKVAQIPRTKTAGVVIYYSSMIYYVFYSHMIPVIT